MKATFIQAIIIKEDKHLPSTSKVQWIDEAERGGSSSTTGGQITHKVAPELSVLVHATQEYLTIHDQWANETKGLFFFAKQ